MKKVTYSALAILMAAGISVAVEAQAREHGATQSRDRGSAQARDRSSSQHQSQQRERAGRSDGHVSRGERRETHHAVNHHGRNSHHARSVHHGGGWHGGRDWGHQRGYGQHARAARGINHQQHRQQVQIRHGVRNGSLTPHEARRLQREQRQIAALERRYRADGVLTRAERRDLRGELRDANRHIYNQSHDGDRRGRR